MDATSRPRLAAKARLRYDRKSSRYMLLYPERGLVLNPTAADVLQRCDGERTVGSVAADLAVRFGAPEAEVLADICAFLADLVDRRLVFLRTRP